MLRNPVFFILFGCFSILFSCKGDQKKTDKTESPSASATPSKANVKKDQKSILFFGTSLTAGYGLEAGQAYPELIQQKLDSLKFNYKVINAGLSGETSAAGKSRIDWMLKQPINIFVLELGANDGLRGIPVRETTANLQFIIDKVKQKYPKAKLLLVGMEVPPNMGEKYSSDFRNIFKKLAAENGLAFLPFLLDHVAGIPWLNQKDGIHPTAKGQTIVADNVWTKLIDLL